MASSIFSYKVCRECRVNPEQGANQTIHIPYSSCFLWITAPEEACPPSRIALYPRRCPFQAAHFGAKSFEQFRGGTSVLILRWGTDLFRGRSIIPFREGRTLPIRGANMDWPCARSSIDLCRTIGFLHVRSIDPFHAPGGDQRLVDLGIAHKTFDRLRPSTVTADDTLAEVLEL